MEHQKPSPFMSCTASLFSIILLPMTQFTCTSAIAINDLAIANCPTKCGNVDISYPFGIGKGCFLEGFEVICNKRIPYLSKTNLELLEILPREVHVSSKNFIAKSCLSENDEEPGQALIQFPEESQYTISNSKNILEAMGCNMLGSASSDSNNMTRNGCYSDCEPNVSMVNGSCNVNDCSKMTLRPVGNNLLIEVELSDPSITNCSHGFVVEDGMYNFTKSDLFYFHINADISTRLGWSVEIGDWNCSAGNSSLCRVNTQCKDSEDEHFCTCLQGYEGNPYLYGSLGCQGLSSKIHIKPHIKQSPEKVLL